MKDVVLLAVSFYPLKQDLPELRLLLRLRDESPGGPWFGAERTTLSPVVDGHLPDSKRIKEGRRHRCRPRCCGIKFCWAARRKGCYVRPNWEIASRGG